MAKLDVTLSVNQISKTFNEKADAKSNDAYEQHKSFIRSSVEKEEIENLMEKLLPACAESIRIFPNIFLRGSLFGVVGKGARKYEENAVKSFVKGISIKFTGKQLDQADLDILSECFHLNQGNRFGEIIAFSSKTFLSEIGRNNGKTDREWLYDSFRRLMGSVIEVGDGRYFYTGQLLHNWRRDEETGKNSFSLNKQLMPFFQDNLWTGLLVLQRKALIGKPLAQWLHAFYSSHKSPFDYKVMTLHELCNSDAILKVFRQKLKKSLSLLEKVTGWECTIQENDLVTVKKTQKQ